MLVSMIAIVVLPRQFHVLVVENVDEHHIKKAIWLFPLYLLLINLFVLPIALGGSSIFQAKPSTPTRGSPCHGGDFRARWRCSRSSAGSLPQPA